MRRGGSARVFCECVKENEEDEKWPEKYAGKFQKLCDAERKAREEKSPPRRSFKVLQEAVGGKRDAKRRADVGCHKMAVGEDGGREPHEKRGDEGEIPAHEFRSPEIGEDDKKEREENGADAGPADDLVGIVSGVVQKCGAGCPLPVHVGFPARLVRREVRLQEEHRKACERFHERRMFRIQTMIKETHIAVSGGDMRAFVERCRVAPCGLKKQNSGERHNAGENGEGNEF